VTTQAEGLFPPANLEVSGPVGTRAGMPTASGGLARAAYARAATTAVDVAALLRQAGLTLDQILSSRERIPVKKQIAFVNRVAQALGSDFLGIELARLAEMREFGLLYYVLASTDYLGLALMRAARFSTILNEGVRISYRQGRNDVVSYDYVGVSRAQDRHQIEFFVVILLRLCRQLTGRNVVPLRIGLSHHRKTVPAKFRAIFGCEVEFAASRDEVVFPARARLLPIINADPYLNSILLQYCEESLARRGQKSGHWRANVENILARLLPHGEATPERVAQSLGVSRRTLARRLASENVTFMDVMHELRLQLARQYLAQSGFQIAEVAWLLGYKEASTFSHAFKRWTGAAPTELRPRNEPGFFE
jgi:AraC-like DNA-binding protein